MHGFLRSPGLASVRALPGMGTARVGHGRVRQLGPISPKPGAGQPGGTGAAPAPGTSLGHGGALGCGQGRGSPEGWARTVRAGGALGAVTAPLLSTCAGRTKAKEDLEDKFLAVEVLPHIRKISGKCCNCWYNAQSPKIESVRTPDSLSPVLCTFRAVAGCFATLSSPHSQIYCWVTEGWHNFSLPCILA